nr:MAG TPA: hypothetical protein [Caudoviricetes sp.]
MVRKNESLCVRRKIIFGRIFGKESFRHKKNRLAGGLHDTAYH